MPRRYAPLRFVVVAVIVLLVLALGYMQLASDALFAATGTPGSLPSHLQAAWGARAYAAIERIAPLPFIAASLARYELDQGDLADAQRYASLLPDSPVRDELLARVAQARGQQQVALEYFLVAPDMDAVQTYVRSLARTDPAAAYALEERLKKRLEDLTTHPDAVAEADWILGEIAAQQRDYARSMKNYRAAIALAPLSEKYLLAAGNEALTMRDWTMAQRYYRLSLNVNPASANALAGLRATANRENAIVP